MNNMSGVSGDNIDIILSCANCGKGEEDGEKLKKCSACLSVKYCSVVCQKAHRPMHKKECKKRAAELYDEKLFKDPPPPEDCPICYLPLIGGHRSQYFQSCCGKRICAGCIYAMMERSRGVLPSCPFCRTPQPISDDTLALEVFEENERDNEEELARLKIQMDKGNADAFSQLASYYEQGIIGMPQDYRKANELYLKAGELGCTEGYLKLGCFYEIGLGTEVNRKKAKRYYELASMNGNVQARCNLGTMEGMAGNDQRSRKHMIIAARSGHTGALDDVKEDFMDGLVSKEEYERTLRSWQKRNSEMKSDERDKAASAFARMNDWVSGIGNY